MSQRDLAAACGVPQATIAQAECGRRGLTVDALSRIAAVAGLRLVLLDGAGTEVGPMCDGAVRDLGGRYFPAHLDTRYGEDGWWHGPERYSRPEPWYTFDRRRDVRDRYRRRDGTPGDHQLPRPGDSPHERRAAARRAALRRAHEERERRREAGLLPPAPEWECDCPPACAQLEDWQGAPKHADGCPCRCDPC